MISRRSGPPSGANAMVPGEVLFEFQRVGHILRVVAIDPVTKTEVTMIADPRHSPEIIKQLAARKLAYVIQKNAAKT